MFNVRCWSQTNRIWSNYRDEEQQSQRRIELSPSSSSSSSHSTNHGKFYMHGNVICILTNTPCRLRRVFQVVEQKTPSIGFFYMLGEKQWMKFQSICLIFRERNRNSTKSNPEGNDSMRKIELVLLKMMMMVMMMNGWWCQSTRSEEAMRPFLFSFVCHWAFVQELTTTTTTFPLRLSLLLFLRFLSKQHFFFSLTRSLSLSRALSFFLWFFLHLSSVCSLTNSTRMREEKPAICASTYANKREKKSGKNERRNVRRWSWWWWW